MDIKKMTTREPPPYLESHRYVLVDRSELTESSLDQVQIIDQYVIGLKQRLDCELRDLVHGIDEELEALESKYILDKKELLCHRQMVVTDRLVQFRSFLGQTLIQRSNEVGELIHDQDGWLWCTLKRVWTMLSSNT